MRFPLDPERVHTLLRAMDAARSIYHGGDAPEPNLAAHAIRSAAAQGMALSFHYVLTDDGEMAWEARLDTGRGTLTGRPVDDRGWDGVFDDLNIAAL